SSRSGIKAAMAHFFSTKRRLNLALQGGGAHGAFTWGVIDRLLREDTIRFDCISAASAGAINAVALAHGLATDGRDAARTLLARVWEDIAKSGVPDIVRLNPFYNSFWRSPAMAQMASLVSPYDFNPLGFDPLREVLTKWIDFEALRHTPVVSLRIAATEVRTGKAHFFDHTTISADAVLASCCLPALHQAIEIDNVAYWDGGFSANPDLVGLAAGTFARDTMLVQLMPLVRKEVPTDAHAISDHVYGLTFQTPLVRDVELICACRSAGARVFGILPPASQAGRMLAHRFHLIDATPHTSSMDWSSKVTPDWAQFQKLFELGVADADVWLSQNSDAIGRRETVDLASHFLHRSAAL
ncbi:MAG: patatin-like phospholipase family protein, partial [Pseudomonadota bacterium]